MQMNKKGKVILIVFLALIGASSAFLSRLTFALGEPGVRLAEMQILNETNKVVRTNGVDLPVDLLQCISEATPITTKELDWLPDDTTYGRRRYTFPDKTWIENNVVLMGKDRTSIHKPEYCLPGQGFTIDRRETVNISIKKPHSYNLPAMKLTTSRPFRDSNGNEVQMRGIYVYWFVADDKLATDHFARMWTMTKGLLTEGELQRWAYISYFAICQPGGEDETYAKMANFISESVPRFQTTTGPPKD